MFLSFRGNPICIVCFILFYFAFSLFSNIDTSFVAPCGQGPTPCRNLGFCEPSYNSRGYTCDCSFTGFIGINCQTRETRKLFIILKFKKNINDNRKDCSNTFPRYGAFLTFVIQCSSTVADPGFPR